MAKMREKGGRQVDCVLNLIGFSWTSFDFVLNTRSIEKMYSKFFGAEGKQRIDRWGDRPGVNE